MRNEAEAKLVDAFYKGVCDDSLLHEAVGQLALYFDSPSACLGEVDTARGRWMIGSGPVDTMRLAKYAEISALDPAPRAFSALPACTASTSDRMFSQRERTRSAFLNEYMRPAGLDHSMGSPLYMDSRRFALVGIHQALSRRRFDDDDLASLERLSPHVARTLQLRRSFADLKRKNETLDVMIDRCETGLVAMRSGKAHFVNRAARTAAAAQDGLTLDRLGRVGVGDRAAARRLAKLENDVLAGGVGGVVHATRPSGARAYIISVSRLPGAADETAVDGEIGVLIAIHDPARRRRTSDIAIAELMHIPVGPAKVVNALLEGHDLKTYAEQAGITLNTVRCHLKAAFARTETHSQTELVRLAASAVTAMEYSAQAMGA